MFQLYKMTSFGFATYHTYHAFQKNFLKERLEIFLIKLKVFKKMAVLYILITYYITRTDASSTFSSFRCQRNLRNVLLRGA